MAGSVRFESSATSPDELPFAGNYPSGQRGSYSGASLDRSGSFRENSESRMFSSGTSTSRGNSTSVGDVSSITQWLMLDPITMGNQNFPRSGELRRVLGISGGSTAEDNTCKAAHSRPLPLATEELKRIKASVLDASYKARGRAKKLVASLLKLNKYCEVLNSKKQHQSDMLTSERTGGSNLLKLGTLMQRNPSDIGTQRLEERTKAVVLNKRVRSSVAEIRAEGRSNTLARQLAVTGKDKDMLKDSGEGSDLADEKIRRLPAGGEGWERKMKRKRSVGTAFTRAVDSDGDLKLVVHHKLNNEPGLQSSDAQNFRSGLSNVTGCITKSDASLPPASSNARLIPKNEVEKVSLSRDFVAGSTKDRLVAKGNNKLSMREENHVGSSSPVTKGKASRGPRTGPVMIGNSSPSFPRAPGALESWEQHPMAKAHSLGGPSNRKRPLPTGSSSPPITQWVGQRPQKISRTRRANLVSPVSNHDEMQTSSEGGPSAELGAKMTSVGTNGLLLARGMASSTHQIRVKHEHASSPARLSESEESGVSEKCENRFKEKGSASDEVEERAVNAVQNVGPPLLLTKKNKILNKEEIGDGVRRQGRTGRGMSFSRASISTMREKLGNTASTKPVKSTRPGSDKNGSKTGRPPFKKLSERRATRLGHTPTSGSPDLSGESDDDREELLAAANLACNSSFLACSSSFWKKMEPVFGSVSLEDKCYLKQQGELLCEDFLLKRKLQHQTQAKESVTTPDFLQVQDIGYFSGKTELESQNKVTPLYQRVLSALIVEDETDEVEDNSGGRSTYQNSVSTFLPAVVESRNGDGPGFLYESLSGFGKQCTTDRFPCNGSNIYYRGTGIHNQTCNDDMFCSGHRFMHPEIGMISEFAENGGDGPLAVHTNASEISSYDCQYEQMNLEDKLMLELQSVSLYPEAVPDLTDGEDDAINQEIVEIQKGLQQQFAKKKKHLNKIVKAIEEVGKAEERGLEQVAMDRLVELAYKKLLATRGSTAAKLGVPKVSKQVALAFMKRTLGRCRKFEDTGKGCFSDPALRDVIFAAPPHGNDAESLNCFGSAVATSVHPESNNCHPEPGTSGFKDERQDSRGSFDVFETLTHTSDQDFAKTGPILNRGKKKEVLLDDVGGNASSRATSALGNTLMGGAKGKRSERERDKDTSGRNSVSKAGRAPVGNFKGERKTKSKPKQKTAQLPTLVNGFIDKPTETIHVYSSASGSGELKNKKVPHGNNPRDSSTEIKETTDTNELDSIDLGVANDLGENQDFSNWFNFDEDNLQDQDLVGLQIPMDDLSELNMF